MTKREKAIAIIDNYSWYHAGTALTVGAFGGQFGIDRYALTALTIAMIESICNVYEIQSRTAKNLYIARAIGRLTRNGTVIAHAILNWLPLGSISNCATTFFLTRNAGMQCIEEIEREKMTVIGQIENIGKDVATQFVCDEISEIMNAQNTLPENIIVETKNVLGEDLANDININKIVDLIDKIPTELSQGVNKALENALKASVKECLFKNPKEINSSKLLKDILFESLCGLTEERVKLTKEEIEFRLLQKDNHSSVFNSFIQDTANRFDRIAKTRGIVEAVKFAYSSISNEYKMHFGVTSEDIAESILSNPYDKDIENMYSRYIPLMKDADNFTSSLAKAAMLYQELHIINSRYNVPNTDLQKIDDRLVFFIAGRIQNHTNLYTNLSTKEIAYKLSEFIRVHKEVLYLHVSFPIIGFCDDMRIKKEKTLANVINKYWIAISNNSHQLQTICADGLVFYIHRLWCRNITEGKDIKLYKDDVLIYTTAELLKENHSDLKDIDIKTIAYYIAEMFDRYF